MSSQKPYTAYNTFFLVPFIAWVVVGGILLLTFDKEVLFKAINLNYSTWGDVFMSWTTKLGEGLIGALILLVLLGNTRYRNWWFVVTALVSNILPTFIIQALKSGVGAPRPLKYFQQAEWIHILPDWQHVTHRSFPSGHTCAAFCLFTFLAFLLPRKYRAFGALFFFIALLVGYSRVYLAAHFFLDIYVGSIIGVVFTIFTFMIMNLYQDKFFRKA